MKRAVVLLILVFFSMSCNANEISLREKIGQMLVVGFEEKRIHEHSLITRFIEEDNIGGVILFDYDRVSKTFDKNIESPKQVNILNKNLQNYTKRSNMRHNRPALPLLISVDYEGGQVNRLHPRYGFPSIPSPKKMGKSSADEANYYANLMANTLKKTGFNLDFAPLVDVDVNPENPVIGKLERSFSSDPNRVIYYANIYSQQLLNKKIQCAYKHFPGHGSSLVDSHLGFADITNTWSSSELIPFIQLINQATHCDMIMVAHVVNRDLDPSGLPATLSLNIISGLLRHDLQFEGVVITDDLQMKAITDHFGLDTAVTLSINAGVDMLIFGNQLSEKIQDPKVLIDIIENKVLEGEISEARINEAYNRIIQFKGKL